MRKSIRASDRGRLDPTYRSPRAVAKPLSQPCHSGVAALQQQAGTIASTSNPNPPGESPRRPPTQEAAMPETVPAQHPAVVLRSHYRHLRALLAIAMMAVVGLSVAVVILADDDGHRHPLRDARERAHRAGRRSAVHPLARPALRPRPPRHRPDPAARVGPAPRAQAGRINKSAAHEEGAGRRPLAEASRQPTGARVRAEVRHSGPSAVAAGKPSRHRGRAECLHESADQQSAASPCKRHPPRTTSKCCFRVTAVAGSDDPGTPGMDDKRACFTRAQLAVEPQRRRMARADTPKRYTL